MNLKEFLKSISIYGLLPILGKFLAFFLIPIYARVFSKSEFGIIELITTLISFLILLCNLEFYSAIGRYFFTIESLNERRRFISTGLILTILSTILTAFLVFVFKDFILENYFGSKKYIFEVQIGIIWLVLNAISTYLSIIPRYEKKPKTYVVINLISILLRLSSTIFFVLILKIGIIGIIFGHIIGDLSSLLLNVFISKKYFALQFSFEYTKMILKYALPLIPGLLLVGFWVPLSRYFISSFFAINILGLYSFALRFTSLNSIFNGALRNAWLPILFENITKLDFSVHLRKISGITSLITLGIGTFITIFSPELCLIIGTKEFSESSVLIGFLVFGGSLQVASQMKGFGPLVDNKTFVYSIFNMVSIIFSSLLFFTFKDKFGLIGLGLIMLMYDFINFLFLSEYTRLKLKINIYENWEFVLVILLVVSIFLNIFNVILLFRMIVLAIITIYYLHIVNYVIGFNTVIGYLWKR